MNIFLNIFSLCLIFSLAKSKPIDGLLDSGDTELVGSNLNKVYATAPFEDLQSEGTGHKAHHGKGHHADDDDQGYYTSKSKKGDNGYKHFDSYHKKGGDKYGYESHSAYGHAKGGKDGGKHYTSGSYHEVDGDDGGSHAEYYDGEGTEVHYGKLKKKQNPKDHKTAATDGDYYYSNYESDGEGDDEGDEGHYEGGEGGDDGGHYSESYEDEGPSSGYYDGEGESEGYYDDGEGETRQQGVIHHGGPAGGATSYSVRHF